MAPDFKRFGASYFGGSAVPSPLMAWKPWVVFTPTPILTRRWRCLVTGPLGIGGVWTIYEKYGTSPLANRPFSGFWQQIGVQAPNDYREQMIAEGYSELAVSGDLPDLWT